MIIVTEKDAVKIPEEVAKENWRIPIYVISVEVKFQEGADEFKNFLSERLADKVRGGAT